MPAILTRMHLARQRHPRAPPTQPPSSSAEAAAGQAALQLPLLLPALILRDVRTRRHLGVLPDFLAVHIEDDGQGDHGGGDASHQGGRPLDAHAREHVLGEERERGRGGGAQKGIRRHRGGGEHEVRIHEVVEQAEEDGEDAEAREQARQGRHDPRDRPALVARPAEPEQPAREGEAAHDGDGEPPLRHGDVVVGFQLAHVRRVHRRDHGERDAFPHHHAEVGESRFALVEAVLALEDE